MMQAFLNDPELKQDLLEEIRWHRQQDAIIQGTYGDHVDGVFKGCAVGCALKSLNKINSTELKVSDHKRFVTELGIPEPIAHLTDTIFERLPREDAKVWPETVIEAIPVGADLTSVDTGFKIWVLQETRTLVEHFDIDENLKQQILEANTKVAEALQTGKDITSAAYAAETAYAAVRAASRAAETAYAAVRAAETAAYAPVRAAETANANANANANAAAAADTAAFAAVRAAAYAAETAAAETAAETAAYAAETAAAETAAVRAASRAAETPAYAAVRAAETANANANANAAAYAKQDFWARAAKQLTKQLKESKNNDNNN